jgi:hypothetical protein
VKRKKATLIGPGRWVGDYDCRRGLEDPMSTISNAYDSIRMCLTGRDLEGYLEPLSHVLSVDALRQAYRPKEVRLLLVAESHVRRPDPYVESVGPGFLYNPNCYTSWWGDLFLPGFGGRFRASRENRREYLRAMQGAGFWMLDMSVIALSRYNRVSPDWPARPFDSYQRQILGQSWSFAVQAEVQSLMRQATPPIVCVYDRVSSVLPSNVLNGAAILRFNTPANSARCRQSDYPFGTERFRQAAIRAGLHNCLS